MTPFIIGWIIAIVAFISIEAATIQLVSIWFMGGALAGMIAAMCGLGFVWQFGLFVAVSALLLAIFRPILRKNLTPKHTRTNADRLIGREALVTEPIDDLRATGAVRVDGVLWTARSETGANIPENAVVTVTRIEGAKLFVRPVEVPVETL
mgnify:CR=1 FL=1